MIKKIFIKYKQNYYHKRMQKNFARPSSVTWIVAILPRAATRNLEAVASNSASNTS